MPEQGENTTMMYNHLWSSSGKCVSKQFPIYTSKPNRTTLVFYCSRVSVHLMNVSLMIEWSPNSENNEPVMKLKSSVELLQIISFILNILTHTYTASIDSCTGWNGMLDGRQRVNSSLKCVNCFHGIRRMSPTFTLCNILWKCTIHRQFVQDCLIWLLHWVASVPLTSLTKLQNVFCHGLLN